MPGDVSTKAAAKVVRFWAAQLSGLHGSISDPTRAFPFTIKERK
jgi:hypothetical protein